MMMIHMYRYMYMIQHMPCTHTDTCYFYLLLLFVFHCMIDYVYMRVESQYAMLMLVVTWSIFGGQKEI